MPKIPECDRCVLYASDPHLVCAVHPQGIDTDSCIDFRPDPNIEPETKWSPKGYSWYGDYLISNRPSKYSQIEQLEMLDNHPFFTGVCSKCQYQFSKSNSTLVHFDCPNCGWIDYSI